MLLLPANDLNNLRAEIVARHARLSKRLQQIASFALNHPNDMALQTIAVIAERAKVQPSALIRFAKAFGYSGFSEMQQVFQAHLAQHSLSYNERIRLFRERQGTVAQPGPLDVLREFVTANILSMRYLQNAIPEQTLNHAIERLAQARDIYIIGLRRSFPVATYLAYALGQIGCRTRLLDGNGGLLLAQAQTMGPEDALFAISFQSYAPETVDVVRQMAGKQIPVIAMTDSLLSPIAPYATVCFEIHEAEVRTFRSLTTSLCLAQTLVVGLGLYLDSENVQNRLEHDPSGTPPVGIPPYPQDRDS